MKGTRVLIVEDELIIGIHLKNVLAARGYRVSGPVPSGEEAISLVETDPPDVLLLDIILDGALDGIKTYEQIRSRFDVPAIFLTAHSDTPTLQRAKETNPYGYVLKPINENELFSVIELALYKHGLERELKNSEEKFRALFDMSYNLFGMLSPEGLLLEMNTASREFTGVDLNDLQGLPFWECPWFRDLPLEQEKTHDFVMRAVKGETIREEILHRSADGSIRMIDFTLKPVKNGRGEVMFLIPEGRDITEIRTANEKINLQNLELQAVNEELNATVEELEATNEEFEAQNTELFRSQQELTRSEEFIRHIMENVPAMIYRMKLADGRYEFVSPHSTEITGYTPEEYYGNPLLIREMIHPDWHEYFNTQWKDLIEGRVPPIYEYQIIHKSGGVRWLSQRNVLIRDEKGAPVAIEGIVTDNTARVRAEEALRASEEKYRGLVENINEVVFSLDGTGSVTYISPAISRLTGYAPEEMLGRSFAEFVHPEDQENLILRFFELTQGVIKPHEYRIVSSSGESRWVRSNSRPLFSNGVFAESTGIITDIHEKRLAEEALEEKSRELENYFTYALDLFCIADTDGYFHRLNREWEKVLGYRLRDLEGKRFLDFVHPDDLDATLEAIAALDSQKEVLSFVNRYRCSDGSYRWIEWRSFPTGKFIYAAARDITKRKLMEEELRENQQFLKNVFDAIQDGISVLDTEFNVIRTNLWMEKMYAHCMPLVGQKCYMAYQQRRTPCTWCPSLLTFKSGEVHSTIVPYPTAENPLGWIELSAFPLKDEQGRVTGVIEYVKDITRQKQDEIELQNREQLISSILSAAPTGIGMVVDRVIKMVNDRLCEITGYTREELVGNSSRMLYPTEEDYRFVGDEKYRQISERGTGTVETRWRCRDGAIIDVLLSSTPIDAKDLSRGVTFTSLDITDRKRAENLLEEKILYFQKIARNVPIVLFAIDRNGVFTLSEGRGLAGLGHTPGEIVGRSGFDVYRGLPQHEENFRRILTGEAFTVEIDTGTHIFDAYHEPLFDEDGAYAGTVGVLVDVTEKKKFQMELINRTEELEAANEELQATNEEFEAQNEELLRSQEELARSEEFIRNIMENVPAMIYRMSLPEGNYEFVSPYSVVITGYTPEEIYKTPFLIREIIHPDFRDYFREQFEKLLAGRVPPMYHYQIIHRSGEVRWLNQRNVLIRDRKGAPLAIEGVITDNTEQVRAREALRESEEKYRLIADNIAETIWMTDLNLRFTYVSPSVKKIRGYTPEEVMAQTLDEFLTPESLQAATELFMNELALEESGTADPERVSSIDLQQRRRDGALIWVHNTVAFVRDEDGKAVGILGVSRDITQRKEAEESLERALALLEAVVDQSPVSIVVASAPDQVIRYANQATGDLLGVSDWSNYRGLTLAEVMRRKTWTDLKTDGTPMDPNDLPIARALRGEYTNVEERSVIRADGTRRWYLVSGAPVHNRAGDLIAGLIAFYDITGRKENEEMLSKNEERFRTLIEASPEPVILARRGMFIYGNKAFCRLIGVENQDSFLGKNLLDFVAPEKRAWVEANITARLRGEPVPLHYESVGIRSDGSTFPYEINVASVELPDGPATLAFLNDITERKATERALKYRYDLESLITDISTRFINLGSDEIDDAISTALRDIGLFTGADRSYLFLFSEDNTHADNTHEWCADGVSSHIDRLRNLAVGDFQHIASPILEGNPYHLPRTADLPPDAAALKAEYELEGILSHLAVPMKSGGRIRGFLGLDAVQAERRWEDDIIALLGLVGNIFAGAMEQKKAEEALRLSEERYRRIVDTAMEGVWQVDSDFRVIFANQRMADMLGYKVSELLGRPTSDFLFEEDVEGQKTKWDRRRKGFTESYERRFRRKDGGVLWTITSASPVFDGEGRFAGSQSMMTDITDRKKAEDELRKSETNYRALYEFNERLNDIFISFTEAQTEERLFTRIAESFMQLMGALAATSTRYNPRSGSLELASVASGKEILGQVESLLGKAASELSMPVPPEMVTVMLNQILHRTDRLDEVSFGALSSEESRKVMEIMGCGEVVILALHYGSELVGTTTAYLPAGHVTVPDYALKTFAYMAGLAVTRKKTDDALRETAQRLQQAAGNLPLVLFAMDRDGVFTLSEGSGLKGLGLEPGQVVGQPVYQVYAEVPEILAAVDRALSGEACQNEVRVGTSWYEVWYTPLYGQLGEISGCTGVGADITDRKLAEAERERIQAQLIQAQKMEALGTLAGGLAHDFNNMLGGIMGSLNLLELLLEKETLSQGETLHRYIETALESSRRAADMTKQLLTLSRKRDLQLAPVDINLSLKHVQKIAKSSFPKTVILDFRIGDTPLRIEADPTQIEQVLLNLCVNASHAMTIMRQEGEREGGTLTVHAEEIFSDRYFCALHPEAREDARYVKILVSDTGVGMDEKTIKHIFDPFYTTKKKDTGTGLGLSMAYSIIKQHRGFIHVYSEAGKGSGFSVYLPVLEKHDGTESDHAARKPIIRGSGRILVIDDEKAILRIARGMLEQCGYDVELSENGEEAIALYAQRHGEIDAVILDQSMPGISGMEVFTRLREINPRVKVLLTSGLSDDESVNRALKKGINGFLQKPYSTDELSAKIKDILGQAPNNT